MTISTQETYYQESGNITPGKLSLGLALTLGASIVLAYIYALVVYISPLVYLNAIVCIGFGFALGLVANYAGRIAHLRSTSWRIGFAVLGGLLAYIFHWCAYLPMVFQDAAIGPMAYLGTLTNAFQPGGLFQAAKLLNSVGVWTISSIPNSGFFGQVIWLAEMLIIVGVPLYMAYRAKVHPYSEAKGRFYEKYDVPLPYTIPSPTLFMQALSSGNFSIADFEEPRAGLFHMISLYYLEGENRHYVDVVKVSVSNKGKEQKTTTSLIIDNLAIDIATARQIKSELGAQKSKLTLF